MCGAAALHRSAQHANGSINGSSSLGFRVVLFVSILNLLFAAVLLTRVARRLSVPYPSLLALGGAALALIPGAAAIELDPSLALAIFVAPVLLDAAYDASPRELRDNRPPIITLVVAVGPAAMLDGPTRTQRMTKASAGTQ